MSGANCAGWWTVRVARARCVSVRGRLRAWRWLGKRTMRRAAGERTGNGGKNKVKMMLWWGSMCAGRTYTWKPVYNRSGQVKTYVFGTRPAVNESIHGLASLGSSRGRAGCVGGPRVAGFRKLRRDVSRSPRLFERRAVLPAHLRVVRRPRARQSSGRRCVDGGGRSLGGGGSETISVSKGNCV